MRILGIETSCDETSAAVLGKNTSGELRILSNVISSSLDLHSKTGGIIPEIAAREQIKYIIPVIQQALQEAFGSPFDTFDTSDTFDTFPIDAIAVTVGPGLIGSLLVGVETAKTLAYVWKKPVIPVNHLHGHIYANFINSVIPNSFRDLPRGEKEMLKQVQHDKILFPALALIVSGAHTDLVLMKKHGDFHLLGGTRDDAAGEAFDKIGRMLNFPYPAGPTIERFAQKGNPKAFQFPRPMIGSTDFDFSFSGLKTAVNRFVILRSKTEESFPRRSFAIAQDDSLTADLCASVQQAITDVLIRKTMKAAERYDVRSILISGGVSANNKLRGELEVRSSELGVKFFAPAKNLCTDNAAMIAAAAFYNNKEVPWQQITANPELYFD